MKTLFFAFITTKDCNSFSSSLSKYSLVRAIFPFSVNQISGYIPPVFSKKFCRISDSRRARIRSREYSFKIQYSSYLSNSRFNIFLSSFPAKNFAMTLTQNFLSNIFTTSSTISNTDKLTRLRTSPLSNLSFSIQ